MAFLPCLRTAVASYTHVQACLPSCIWVRRICISRAAHFLDDWANQNFSPPFWKSLDFLRAGCCPVFFEEMPARLSRPFCSPFWRLFHSSSCGRRALHGYMLFEQANFLFQFALSKAVTFFLHPMLLKLHISSQLIDSFSTLYGLWSCIEEKLSFRLCAHAAFLSFNAHRASNFKSFPG